MRSFPRNMAWVCLVAISLTMFGCGGGGGGSSDDDMAMNGDGNGNGGGGMMDCPPGQMRNADDECVDEAPAGPSQAEIDALTMAIADSDGDGDFGDELGHSNRPSAPTTLASGGDVTVDDDILGKNDANIPNSAEFMKANESRLELSSDYEASVYKRTKSGKTDTLTVYSNVADPESQHFNTYPWASHAGITVDTSGTDVTSQEEEVVGREETLYHIVTIAQGVTSADADKMTGAKIPPGPSTNRSIDADEEFSGTFFGIPGTYSCGSGGCNLSRNDQGLLTASGGTFTFRPTKTTIDTQDDHMVEGVILDSDYLVLGYWLQESAGGEYSVGVFAEGIVAFDYGTTTVDSLDGTATYDGSATGMYAKKDLAVVDGKIVGTPSEVGQFSADVSLTANFGNDGFGDISANEVNKISGTIDNFESASGAINPDWSVELMTASLSGVSNNAREFGGDTTGSGEWTGQFYEADTTTTAENQRYPMSVAGEFTGHFEDGHVIGAFGATR